MQTPVKISVQEFTKQRNAYFAESCTWDRSLYRHRCRKCKMPIQFVSACLSLHDGPFSDTCGGAGKVLHAPVPYCPQCEILPASSGGLHPYPASEPLLEAGTKGRP